MVVLSPEEKEAVARVNAYLKKLYEKAEELHKLDRNAEAMVCWDKALEIDSENAYALHHKGVLLEEATRNAEAIDYYDKALSSIRDRYTATKVFDPEFIAVLRDKSILLAKLHENQEAILCCDIALKIDPNNSQSLATKGLVICILEHKIIPDVLAYCNKALEIDPNNFLALKIKSWETHHGPPV